MKIFKVTGESFAYIAVDVEGDEGPDEAVKIAEDNKREIFLYIDRWYAEPIKSLKIVEEDGWYASIPYCKKDTNQEDRTVADILIESSDRTSE